MSRAAVDAILSEVGRRSTVYASEIITPLVDLANGPHVIDTQAPVWHAIRVLKSRVSECNGEQYLHGRDSLNVLLDLRQSYPEETT